MFKTRCDTLDIQEEACHVFVLTLQWGCVLTSAYCFPSVEQIINITRLLMMDSGINNLVIDGSTRGWVNAGMQLRFKTDGNFVAIDRQKM